VCRTVEKSATGFQSETGFVNHSMAAFDFGKRCFRAGAKRRGGRKGEIDARSAD
jgi:hypothetical protein